MMKDNDEPYEIIKTEKTYYIKDINGSGENWPCDVTLVFEDILEHLFEMDLRVRDVLARCGCHDNNISTRFRHFVGVPPQEYILHHRVHFAKRLLRRTELKIGDIAMGVGYGSPGAFTATFSRRVGVPPSEWRRSKEK